jgi:sugar phosphate isomerase/epimerase
MQTVYDIAMSTTIRADLDSPIDRCRPADVTPVTLDAASLETTAPEYLRELKRELTGEGLFPAELTVEACFDEDCSLATQDEVDRIREYVRTGAFLGVGSVTVSADDVASAEKVRPALAACAERAEREGIELELDAPITLEH